MSCVEADEITKTRHILVEVETADCVSDFHSFLLSFAKMQQKTFLGKLQSYLIFTVAQMGTCGDVSPPLGPGTRGHGSLQGEEAQ